MGKWFFELSFNSFAQTYSKSRIFTEGSGGQKGGCWNLVSSGKGGCLDLVVEERVGARNLCCGVLSTTTHPQQYREFWARQARNKRYWSVHVLIRSRRFESLLGRCVPNSTGSSRIRRSTTVLLLCTCPHLILRVRISFRATCFQQYRELLNPKI